MTRFEAREHLSAYLDGELSSEDLARMDEALSSDESLAADLRELRSMVDGLRALPEVQAPPGLMSRVLAEVGALPLPGAEDLATESGELAPAPAPRVIRPVASRPTFLEGLTRLSWWLKGPALSAAAAALVVGISIGVQSPSPPAPMAVRGAPGDAEWAPLPSGLLQDGEGAGDAVADLGLDAETDAGLDGRAAMEPLLPIPSPTVLAGVAAPDAPRPAAPPAERGGRSRQARSLVGPDGVYETRWEDQGDAVAAAEEPQAAEVGMEADAAPASAGSAARSAPPVTAAFAPDASTVAPPAAARTSESLRRDAGDEAPLAELTIDGEPLEDYLDPPADDDIVAAGRLASAAGPSASPRTTPAGRSGTGGPVSVDEVTFTGVDTNGTLVVADRAAADQLVQTLQGRGWTASVSASQGKTLVLQIRVPPAAVAELRRILSSRGSLNLGSTPSAVDGQVGLRISVAW